MKMEKMMRSVKITAILILLFAIGCSGDDIITIKTIESGPFIIEIAASGGILEMGDNTVQIRVTENNQSVNIEQVQLSFWMPPMGTMERMDIEASLSSNGSVWSGIVNFSMAGSWNGIVEVQVPEGPVSGNFAVQVAIPE